MEEKLTGIWSGWRWTTDHAASSYGQPVLVSPDGRAFGPGDIAGRYSQNDLAKAQGVSRAAITNKIKRGSLPPFDGEEDNGRGYWVYETISSYLPGAADSFAQDEPATYTIRCSNGWTSTFDASSDGQAKRSASRDLAFGCGDMHLYREDGTLLGIRRFYQNGNHFGWEAWTR